MIDIHFTNLIKKIVYLFIFKFSLYFTWVPFHFKILYNEQVNTLAKSRGLVGKRVITIYKTLLFVLNSIFKSIDRVLCRMFYLLF